jgi:hypothetical protein
MRRDVAVVLTAFQVEPLPVTVITARLRVADAGRLLVDARARVARRLP